MVERRHKSHRNYFGDGDISGIDRWFAKYLEAAIIHALNLGILAVRIPSSVIPGSLVNKLTKNK
jgi:hypothetical protein